MKGNAIEMCKNVDAKESLEGWDLNDSDIQLDIGHFKLSDTVSNEQLECLRCSHELRRLNMLVSDLYRENQDYRISNENTLLELSKSSSQFEKDKSELNSKLEEKIQYYVSLLSSQKNEYEEIIFKKEQEQISLTNELERLRKHLIRMSESFNSEAIIAEEREKQLKLALSNFEKNIQPQDNSSDIARLN